jgi:hypothetical protein
VSQADDLALEEESPSPSLFSHFYNIDVIVYATGRQKFAWCTLCHDLDKPSAIVIANIQQLKSKGISGRVDCEKRMSLLVGKGMYCCAILSIGVLAQTRECVHTPRAR